MTKCFILHPISGWYKPTPDDLWWRGHWTFAFLSVVTNNPTALIKTIPVLKARAGSLCWWWSDQDVLRMCSCYRNAKALKPHWDLFCWPFKMLGDLYFKACAETQVPMNAYILEELKGACEDARYVTCNLEKKVVVLACHKSQVNWINVDVQPDYVWRNINVLTHLTGTWSNWPETIDWRMCRN